MGAHALQSRESISATHMHVSLSFGEIIKFERRAPLRGASTSDSQRCLEACKMGHQSIHPSTHTRRAYWIIHWAPRAHHMYIYAMRACVRRGFSRRSCFWERSRQEQLTHSLCTLSHSLTLHNPATFVMWYILMIILAQVKTSSHPCSTSQILMTTWLRVPMECILWKCPRTTLKRAPSGGVGGGCTAFAITLKRPRLALATPPIIRAPPAVE
jgi:hypothetical protein